MKMTNKNNLFDIKGKVAVITGGLGKLGTEYAKTLVNHGAKVVIIDVVSIKDDHELFPYVQKDMVLALRADITKIKDLESALSVIEKKWDTPNILINNAAIDFPPSGGGDTFETYPLEKLQKVLDVNLTGTIICCQIFGGAMAKAKNGSIINIYSTYGIVSPDQRIYTNFIKPVSYSVTKSGILNLTRYLATYWATSNVRVNTLSPGGVFNNQPKDFVERYNDRTPLGRMANADEYNGAILFLSSDASRYMTGANLVIDGGWTAW